MVHWSWPPGPRERVLLERTMRRRFERGVTLQAVVRQTASKNASLIGTELMAIHIPRRSVETASRAWIIPADDFNDTTPSFCYLPTFGSPRQFGPNFVSKSSMITNFEAGPL
jgi:hypothetical protein